MTLVWFLVTIKLKIILMHTLNSGTLLMCGCFWSAQAVDSQTVGYSDQMWSFCPVFTLDPFVPLLLPKSLVFYMPHWQTLGQSQGSPSWVWASLLRQSVASSTHITVPGSSCASSIVFFLLKECFAPGNCVTVQTNRHHGVTQRNVPTACGTMAVTLLSV